MNWTELRFGKHKGKTLPQVLFCDPDWFFWAYERQAFQGAQRREANVIYIRATNIRIPQPGGKTLVVEYLVHPLVNKFDRIDLVPESQPRYQGSARTFRSRVIDMSVPQRMAEYDKLGSKAMINAIKYHVMGDENTRMTKTRCEEFFNDLSHFSRTA